MRPDSWCRLEADTDPLSSMTCAQHVYLCALLTGSCGPAGNARLGGIATTVETAARKIEEISMSFEFRTNEMQQCPALVFKVQVSNNSSAA